MNGSDAISFSATALYTLADLNAFNCPPFDSITECKTFDEGVKRLSKQSIKKISDNDPLHTQMARVIRFIAALFITTVIAPIGAVFHFTKTTYHISLFAIHYLYMPENDPSTNYHKRAFSSHFEACMMDTIASVSGMSGLLFFVNPIAFHFAFSPNAAACSLLSKDCSVTHTLHLTMKHQFALLVKPDEIPLTYSKFMQFQVVQGSDKLSSLTKIREATSSLRSLRKSTKHLVPKLPACNTSSQKSISPFIQALGEMVANIEKATWTIKKGVSSEQLRTRLILSKKETPSKRIRRLFKALQQLITAPQNPDSISHLKKELVSLQNEEREALRIQQLNRAVSDQLTSRAPYYYFAGILAIGL